jgi:hypothetical protein
MTWNYRIIKKQILDTDEDYYYLSEVFYQKDGSPMAYAEECQATGASKEEVIEVLKIMLKDAKRLPVIDEKEFFTGKKDEA